ncbi:MAG: hypothetical protein ACI8RZ_006000, partial [Myxococcota bacterium]
RGVMDSTDFTDAGSTSLGSTPTGELDSSQPITVRMTINTTQPPLRPGGETPEPWGLFYSLRGSIR